MNPINFNLNLDTLQLVDVSKGKLDSGAAGLPSAVWDNGSYSNPGTVTNTWCLTAVRQNPETPPVTVCP
jgi:hypothetical protein